MIEFTVRGLPVPQGSKRAFVNRYSGRAQIVEDSKRVRPWRADVREAAEKAMGDGLAGLPITGPVQVEIEFRMPRPKSHYGTGRNAELLRHGAPEHPDGRPDIDKLARAILDAVSLVVIADDDQVVELIARKRYVQPAGAPAWLAWPGVKVSVRTFR